MQEYMMIEKTHFPILTKLLALCESIYITMYFVIPDVMRDYILLIIFLVCLIISNFKVRIMTNRVVICWLAFLIIQALSITHGPDVQFCTKVFLTYLILFILGYAHSNISELWTNIFLKYLYLFSFINSCFIIIQVFASSFVSTIAARILSVEQLETNYDLLSKNAFAGITGQTGTAGYLAAITMTISVMMLFERVNKKRCGIFPFISLVLGLIALLLSQKRGILLAWFIAFFLFIIQYFKNKGHNIIKPFLIGISSIVMMSMIILFVPEARGIIEKFSNAGLAGREIRINVLLEMIKEAPIFGCGVGAFQYLTNMTSHNEYLLIFAELGIIGLTFFVVAIIFSIKNARNISNRINLNSQEEQTNVYGGKLICNVALFILMFSAIYALSGNPLSSREQLYLFFICVFIVFNYYSGEYNNAQYVS